MRPLVVLAAVNSEQRQRDGKYRERPRHLSQRAAAWRDGWDVVRDFPFFGTGLNTYSDAMLFYQQRNPGFHLAQAHNDYVQVLAEGGLLVAIPAAIAVQEVFEFSLQIPADALLFCTLAAASLTPVLARSRPPRGRRIRAPKTIAVTMSRDTIRVLKSPTDAPPARTANQSRSAALVPGTGGNAGAKLLRTNSCIVAATATGVAGRCQPSVMRTMKRTLTADRRPRIRLICGERRWNARS